MGCKIIFSPQALADLEAAVRFIAEENPDAAARVGNALVDRVAILENFPLLGSLYPKRSGVRKLWQFMLTLAHNISEEILRICCFLAKRQRAGAVQDASRISRNH